MWCARADKMAPANTALAAQRKAARAQLGDTFSRFDIDLDGCLRAIDLSQLSLYIDVDGTLSADCPASIRPTCCQRLLPSGTKCGPAALNPMLKGLCLGLKSFLFESLLPLLFFLFEFLLKNAFK